MFLLVGNTTYRLFGACWGCDSSILKYLPDTSVFLSWGVGETPYAPPTDFARRKRKNLALFRIKSLGKIFCHFSVLEVWGNFPHGLRYPPTKEKHYPTRNLHEPTFMSENVAQLFFRMVGVLPVPPNDLSQLQAKNVLKEGPSQWVTVLVNNSRPPQKLMTYFTGLFFQKFANFWKSNTVKYRCVNFFYLP